MERPGQVPDASRPQEGGGTPIRVLIADDHSLFRQGLARILADFPELRVVGEAASGEEAAAPAERLAPDVVLMDVRMPGGGSEATRLIRESHPEIQVIMLTVSDKDEDLFAALQAGARGYLLKDAPAHELVEAIHRVRAGQAMIAPAMTARLLEDLAAPSAGMARSAQRGALTERESQVLRFVARGLGNREIAARLGISEHTVKTHIAHILEKLQVRTRAQAAACAVKMGLVDDVRPGG